MNIDWLEPVIKERSEVISENVLSSSDSYANIMKLLESNRSELPGEFLYEIESLIINHTREVVHLSFRSGVDEALF